MEKVFVIRNKCSEMRVRHHYHSMTMMQASSSSSSYLVTVFFVVFLLPGGLWIEQCAGQCGSTSSLVGFTADFTMVQHQLRGTLRIVDDCSFTVSRFDMLAGVEVFWWGALGNDVQSLLDGQPISEGNLVGTYSNATLQLLLDGSTWDEIKVLSVWDKATASDFGHVILQPVAPPPTSGSGVSAPTPGVVSTPLAGGAPGPSPGFASNPPSYEYDTPPSTATVGEWQPTMFDNCIALTPVYRMRWTLDVIPGMVDIGLEFALTKTQYMAFGWANPENTQHFMLKSDVVVAGIDDKGIPISEDYYISSYSECNWDSAKPAGVCPDSVFAGSTNSNFNNSKMLYGQQVDGITLVRYRRPLESGDIKYDVSINVTDSMTVIWGMGTLAADNARVHFTPQFHGMPRGVKFGYRNLTLSSFTDECNGPLAASNASQGNNVVADRGTSLVVTSDTALQYPNPPNPAKVLYINQKESPVLKVERGVPVTFLVEAGHGVSLYITSDPIGGHAGLNESIYAGGPDAHGVPTSPNMLSWLPDHSTPNEVFYQSYFQPKMGWKVQVVDGGLSDMYNTSTLLADNQVTLFWTLTSTEIFLAVRAERKSGYLAIALGSGMVNSFAYVGWIDSEGMSHVGTYWIDAKDASGIHATTENLSNKKCERQNGIITFEFSRPLKPLCQTGKECRNVIDPISALKMVWAMGDEWSDNLTNGNVHTVVSSMPTLIYLASGAAKVEELQPVLAVLALNLPVHGFMMFLAWGLFFPGGMMAARYMKHLDQWFQIHVYAQASGIFVTLLGLLFAVAELQGLDTGNKHMKLGITCILLACFQASNGLVRPKKATPGEHDRLIRKIWVYLHQYMGRAALGLGFITLLTGITQLGERDGFDRVRSLQAALFAWFLLITGLVMYIEMCRTRRLEYGYKIGDSVFEQGHIIGEEEEDSRELLQSSFLGHTKNSQERSEALGMEVQLEAF